MKQNASPGAQSEALRRRWKPGQEQHPEQENQDSQHMLNQPRGSFPERTGDSQSKGVFPFRLEKILGTPAGWRETQSQRAQRSKRINLDRNFQSRSKFLISLEIFNLDVSISPQKIGPRWVARSKISFSIEIFNLDRHLEFFDLWALWGGQLAGAPEIARCLRHFCWDAGLSIGCTPRGSCNRTLLRRVLRRLSNSKCFLEPFLEGAL